MRDRFDVIAQHCADLGLDIVWLDLGARRRGECRIDADRIVLSSRMTLTQAACTAAHELGHWTFGDRESTPAAERRAWQYGAALLIEPGEYRRAEALVGPHLGALAVELGVTARTVEAWRSWWETKGHLHAEAQELADEGRREAAEVR